MKLEYVRHRQERLFQSDFLERMSKIHPATPFVFYTPIIVSLLSYGVFTGKTTVGHALLFVPAGYLIWCFMEYALHRSFFHWEGSGPLTRRLHAIIHGYHHSYPDDPDRLVMPLGASVPLGIVVALILYAFDAPSVTIPLYFGIVLGYMLYDYLHWFVHCGNPKSAWGKAMRAHHMAHHFACPDKNFGISHRWVDVLLGSLRKRE